MAFGLDTDILNKAYKSYMDNYAKKHDLFFINHDEMTGLYVDGYKVELSYRDPEMHISVKNTIILHHHVSVFKLFAADKTKAVLESNLKYLNKKLIDFENKVQSTIELRKKNDLTEISSKYANELEKASPLDNSPIF